MSQKNDTNSKQSIKRVMNNNLFLLGYAARYTPGYLIFSCVLAAFGEIEYFLEIAFSTKYIMDTIQFHRPFLNVVYYLGMLSILLFIKIVGKGIQESFLQKKSEEKLHKHIQLDLYDKAVKTDLGYYDDPKYYNEFIWSLSESNKLMDKTLQNVQNLVRSATAMLVTGALFVILDKIGLIFVLVTFGLNFAINFKISRLNFVKEVELKPIGRKRSYINRVFYLNNSAKEIRLNSIVDKLKKDFSKSNDDIIQTLQKYSNKLTLLGFVRDYLFSNLILNGVYLIYLLFSATVKSTLSYGSVLSLYNSTWDMKHRLQSIANTAARFQENSLSIEKIRSFLNSEQKIKDSKTSRAIAEGKGMLELRNVSFSYGDNQKDILKDISLIIRPNEKIALVGYNGAGKTTLTKLLMRLYDVKKGEILYHGVNIKDYKIEDYRNCFGTIFQDYQIFAASVAENVLMDKVGEQHYERIQDAMQHSGFAQKYKELEQGMRTQLSREFDDSGTLLSGGESQKLAIARVFAKNCDIQILDEPSSALDPISEYNLNQAMLDAAEDKTVIFISHRLSTTMMADRIYMLENGEIIEQGSHEELMGISGKYAEMFRVQAEKYR